MSHNRAETGVVASLQNSRFLYWYKKNTFISLQTTHKYPEARLCYSPAHTLLSHLGLPVKHAAQIYYFQDFPSRKVPSQVAIFTNQAIVSTVLIKVGSSYLYRSPQTIKHRLLAVIHFLGGARDQFMTASVAPVVWYNHANIRRNSTVFLKSISTTGLMIFERINRLQLVVKAHHKFLLTSPITKVPGVHYRIKTCKAGMRTIIRNRRNNRAKQR